MTSIISMIQMMYIIRIINIIIVIGIIAVMRTIIIIIHPRSTSFAEFRHTSSPRSAKPSCHWQRVDVCLSPHWGPAEYVESFAQKVRLFLACHLNPATPDGTLRQATGLSWTLNLQAWSW